ncbi:HLH-domain-containing protein [Trametopsis cervina]|nr:HLH-domain-containing protein [Trametopsis cervina]
MATAFYSSYKPQILSRQEGFHLPSPAPSTPPSDGTPSSLTANGAHSSSSANAFDTHSLFMSPPSYLSVPETFRKFPSNNADPTGHNNPSMDFSDELASLISHPHNSSHERSTQSPVSLAGYDDYPRPTTHNIFDISAPTSHHHHQQHSHHSHHVPPSPHSPYPPGGSAFSLPPSNAPAHGLHTPGSSLQTPTHPLHEFASHFNSTVPAIGSSMRYEPPSSSHGHSSTGPSSHPFALNVNTSGPSTANNNNAHSPGSNASTNGNEPSSFSSHTFSDTTFAHLHGGLPRQTPSPVLPPSSHGRDYSRRGANGAGADDFSRSRSRSRSTAQHQQQPSATDPPSTNGGPARTARATRPKRGSVSSVSPPPLHRGLTQPLIIPTSSPAPSNSTGGARSPLSLHTSGWFGNGLNGYGLNAIGTTLGGMGEFSLPTPDSVHGHGLFGSAGTAGGSGGSPKELGLVSGKNAEGGAGGDDVAAKQAQIANEKRRRRRESHNAVERRRRDNINEKISELATLIPECLLDPNSTMTMPATLTSATSDDLLFGAGGSAPVPAPPASATSNGGGSPDGGKKEDAEDKDGDAAGAVKANKGMILRKSVEYIRYLQQLVSAQATRNRELEQQLQSFRGPSSGSSTTVNGASEDDALMLHEEVGGFSLGMPAQDGKRTPKKFGGFELESVAEMEQDTLDEHNAHQQHMQHQRYRDEQDQDMERPSTAGTGASPLSASGSDDNEHEHEHAEGEQEEEERGRKGRDGRPMGYGAAGLSLKVEEGMETC